ncbi:hypothetical protein ACLOJK_027263 [Asimina triloba]
MDAAWTVGGRMIAGSLADAGSCRCRPILLEWATPHLIVAEQGCWDADLGGALVAALCSWKDATLHDGSWIYWPTAPRSGAGG